MPNRAELTAASSLDQTAYRLVATLTVPIIGSGDFIFDIREGTKLVQIAGETPGFAAIEVPMESFGPGQWDELAPVLALKDLSVLTPRARCTVDYLGDNQTIEVMTGTVTQINHLVGNDGLLITVFDDKFLLAKVTCFGRMVFDPNFNISYFDSAAPLIFNENGYPDCIDANIVEGGGIRPRFAPSHRFGYNARYNLEDFVEPARGQAFYRARTWTVADAIQYFRDAHYARDGNHRPQDNVDYGNYFIDSHIVWTPGLSDGYLGFNRPLKHFVCENKPLLTNLGALARKAGPYELNMQTSSDYTSELQFSDMNPQTNQGQIINLPEIADDVKVALSDPTCVFGGAIQESIVNFFDEVVIAGDPPACERFITVEASADLPVIHTDSVDIGLQFNWADSDFSTWKSLITNNGNNKLAFQMATSVLPNVVAAYRLQPFFNIWAGTKWDVGFLGPAYYKLQAWLLTQFNDSVDRDSGGFDPRCIDGREVVVEYRPQGATSWSRATRYDDLKLSMDRQYFTLNALRDMDNPQTFSNTNVNPYFGATITPNEIRICIAAEAFWRITGLTRADPNNTALRVAASTDYPWTYLAVGEKGDYIEWLRKSSKPVGKVGLPADILNFSWRDKCLNDDELFTDKDRIQNHAEQRLRDVKRIEYVGQLTFQGFNPGLKPGDVVNINGNNIIPVNTIIRQLSYDSYKQMTTADFGCRDIGGVYDVPSSTAK